MKHYGIQKQTQVVVLIPILLMAILLAYYFIYARFADLESALLERSQSLVRQFALSSEYAVFSRSNELLQQNVDAALAQPDVSRVLVLDASASQLMDKGADQHAITYANLLAKADSATPVYQDAESLILYESIAATQIKFNELDSERGMSPTPVKPVGAVIVEISKHRLSAQKHEILLLGFAITVLVMVVALMLALWATRRTTRPIVEMNRAIRSFGQGNLDARILQPTKVIELNELSLGFNEMAQRLQHNQETLETRVKERTSALAASELKLRTILENTPDTIARYDSELRRVYVNQAFADIAGKDTDTLLGKMPSESPGGTNSIIYEEKIKEVFATGENTSFELKWTGHDGKEIYTQIRLTAELASPGNITSVLGIGRDITALKLAEQQLNERNEETIILRDQAVAANEAKSEFLANMSHEIRTPMNSILGMAILALGIKLPLKARNYIEKIHLSGQHLLDIIEEILDFSKINAGKIEIEEADFDLTKLLEQTKILFEDRMMEKGLAFVFDIDPTLPSRLHGDQFRLGKVLINYLSNAIKFTEKGGITVRAIKLDENEDGVRVRFEVQDSGIGLSEEAQSLLFQPFQQADTSTTREYGGTGLGLAISRQLVELMREGETGVESALGQGSTFWFSVRLGMPHAAAHDPIDEPSELSEQAGRLHGASILLADDNPLNREVANDILVHGGAVVSMAQNGEEAFELLKNHHFDCVLMDIQMPVMDGFVATRLIRLDAKLAEIPVIALTANASKENRERCLASGMNDFISKPFNPKQFYQTIAKWLNSKDVKSEAGKVKCETGNDESDEETGISESQGINSESGILDLSVLSDMVGGSKLRMRNMVQKFVKTTQQDMSGMEAALVSGDYEELRRLAHYVRGPAEMLGAKDFAMLCMELGKRCKGKSEAEPVRDVIGQMYAMLDKINEHGNDA